MARNTKLAGMQIGNMATEKIDSKEITSQFQTVIKQRSRKQQGDNKKIAMRQHKIDSKRDSKDMARAGWKHGLNQELNKNNYQQHSFWLKERVQML